MPNDDENRDRGVMVFADLEGGDEPVLYYLTAEQLKEFKMPEGTPGYGEGSALVQRGVVLSAVATTQVPIGSFSTLVNVAALRPPKEE